MPELVGLMPAGDSLVEDIHNAARADGDSVPAAIQRLLQRFA
jgi:hypothetical protein